MSKVDKEVETKRAIEEKNKDASERNDLIRIEDVEESYSYSSRSIYIFDSDREISEVPSYRSPTLIEVQIPDKHEEVHSSLTMDKNLSKRHSKVQQEEEDPSSYNIEEIVEAFTFNLFKKEVSQKRVWNEKQNDGTLREIQEDEVLFEKTVEDPIIVAIASTKLSKATTHNVTVLNENIYQDESNNNKLKDEIISLIVEVNKRRKLECDTTPLQEAF